MAGKLMILIAVLALVASACGGDDEEAEGVATLESSTTTSVAVTETTTITEFSEQQALDLAQCMRDQGLDFPDPTVDADGNLTMGDDFDPTVFGSTPEEIQSNLQSALDACSEYLEGMTFGGGQLPDLIELQDTFLEFTTCMRENGYDMPDPDFSDGGFGGFFELGENIDPNDPAFQAAMAECQTIFTQLQQP